MSVDVRVSAERPIKCPHCGEIVNYITITDETSGGDIQLEFLEDIGYYAPYDEQKADAYDKIKTSTDNINEIASRLIEEVHD